MSTSHYKNNSTSGRSASGTKDASTAFWQAMDREVGTIHAERGVGENGADQWSMYGCAGEKASQLQGAFVAAFSGLVRGCTQERTREFLVNIETEAKLRGGQVHKNSMATLIVLAFQLRNCRGGKGEKDLSRWLFMELYLRFPKTVKALVPLFPKYGYWKDMNLFVQDCYADRNYKDLLTHIYQTMVDQLLDDDASYDQWQSDNAAAAAAGKPFDKKAQLSLLAKFVPKEGRALDKKCKTAKRLAELLYPEQFKTDFKVAMRLYRQLVTKLNDAISTTEVLMSAGRFSEINFHLVASRCLNKNRRAFLNLKGGSKCKLAYDAPGGQRSTEHGRVECRQHLLDHMEKAKRGEVTLKGKQLFIHEITSKLGAAGSNYGYGRANSCGLAEEEAQLLELQWRTHREALQARLKELGLDADGVVPMIDVSGSMSGTPLEVALAMGIMMTEIAQPPFGDRYIAFAGSPRWIEFKKEWTLRQKIAHAIGTQIHDCSTDFLAAHDLVLATAIKHKLTPDQLPKTFAVFSDMQFNEAARSGGNNSYPVLGQYADAKLLASLRGTRAPSYGYASCYSGKTQKFQTHHQILVETYRKVGLAVCGQAYELPHTVYWNLRGDTVGFPAQADTPNTQMISGFSADMIPLVLECRVKDYEEKAPPTPWDTFVTAMDDEQYDEVHQVVATTAEGLFRGYRVPVREMDEDTVIVDLPSGGGGASAAASSPSSGSSTDDEMPPLETDSDTPDLVVVGTPTTIHQTPPQAPTVPSAAVTTSSSRTGFSTEEVANWFGSSLGLPQSVIDLVRREEVDGAVMEMIVKDEDRSTLVELDISSRLKQTRVFTEWLRLDC